MGKSTRVLVVVAAALMTLGVAGCNGGLSTAAVRRGVTSADVVSAFKAKGLAIAEVKTFSAGDPNTTGWHDKRRPYSSDFDVHNGGAVEVYASETSARHMYSSLKALSERNPVMFNEYDWRIGEVLLRVSGELSPHQAKAYDEAAQAFLHS